MHVSIPRKLDAHEVGVLTVLEKFTGPVSVTKLMRKVEPPTLPRSAINQALDRLETDGYICRSRPNLRGPRYYNIEPWISSVAAVQIVLKGEIDTYTLEDWVLAAMWHSAAIDKPTAVGSGWAWHRIVSGWGKTVPAAAVADTLLKLAAAGFLSSDLSGSHSRFYATFKQRDRIRDKILPDFPLLPGCQAKVAKPATKQGIQSGEGPMSAFLTESGRVALRTLYRHGRDMTARQVGQYFHHIHVEPRTGPLHEPYREMNARTLAAAAALRKLCCDGYATRQTQQRYGLTSDQRGLVHLHFPKWKTKVELAPARVPAPYEAELGPVERAVLKAAVQVQAVVTQFSIQHVAAVVSPVVILDQRFGVAVCRFMLNRLVDLQALTFNPSGHYAFDSRQLVMAQQVLGLDTSDDAQSPEESRAGREARNGRAVELD